jgi:ubiquinol-cytochrome c reductase cytochrome c subunit
VRLLAASLSAKRRKPIAGFVVLLLGLLMTGGLYALFSPAQAKDTAASTDDIAKGRALFLVGCASCHGQSGEGIVTKRGTQYGPTLVGVGAAAVDFQVSTGRMPASQPGAQIPQKQVVYNDEEVRQLAAYVASLGPGPTIPTQEQYDPNAIPADQREEAIVRGGEFFRTNCTACHNFAASGGALSHGKFAPSLVGVSEKHIYEAMLTGPQQMDVFSDANLTPEEKREVIAYLKSIEHLPKYAGFNLGSIGPVSEGLFAWLVGVGSCVGFGIWIAGHSARSTKKKGASA